MNEFASGSRFDALPTDAETTGMPVADAAAQASASPATSSGIIDWHHLAPMVIDSWPIANGFYAGRHHRDELITLSVEL